MLAPVKSRRRYHSPQRQQQALATRTQIVDAAGHLFTRDGYFGTTIEAIAQQAGVAAPTVYAVFGNKREILSALIDAAIFGSEPPRAPIEQRARYREIATIADAGTVLRRWAEALCEVNERVAPVQRVLESAARSDPRIGELLQRAKDQRLVGQSAVARLLADRQALRVGLSTARAADIIFVLSDAHLYDSCVLDRGWSRSQVAEWLGDVLCHLLLPEPSDAA